MDLALADEDVAALARRVAAEAQATTTRHDIEVRAPEATIASVDPVRVELVLRNVLDNAVKFSTRIIVRLPRAGVRAPRPSS